MKFEDESDFDSCKWDMERFTRNSKEYVDCLEQVKSEAQDKAKEAEQQFNEAVGQQNEAVEQNNKAIKKFNCLASGEDFCL